MLIPEHVIHRRRSLKHFSGTETPSGGTSCGMLPSNMWTPDQLDLKVEYVHFYLTPPNIRKMFKSRSHPLLLENFSVSSLGRHGYERISLLYPPLPGKAIKLSFFTSAPSLSLRLIWHQCPEKLSFWHHRVHVLGFPGGSDDKESACNVGDSGSIPGWGRSPGEENGYPLQYSCLEIPRTEEPDG